ncbi:hypothetical protein P4H67_08970 [Paenibacillus lautus]|uniref:hypothetical protein n=1 Tax=Paenibacillus lautus TaxID=1401 RepID=UPI002DBCE2F2|nr:hypothetical protein [Paenibacillus lautus]MEC0306887.1 hypothetical protein [Paenibacillus lautus]
MAVIGDRLASPETGWKRYDTVGGEISYSAGTWSKFAATSSHLGESPLYSSSATSKITFAFVGTKIRLIHRTYLDQRTTVVSIDGVSDQYATKDINSNGYGILCYEKTGLDYRKHFVEISYLPDNSISGAPDAIDIDDAGSLLHNDEVTNIKDLDVGKRIRCNYSAASGVVGVFRGLGQETANFIPVASTATPNGDFYFIMVEDFNKKKILVADRNIQHSISWNTLNSSGIASGSGLELRIRNNSIPIMTSNTLPSGVARSDTNTDPTMPAYHAFDNSYTTSWKTNSTKGQLSYQFPAHKIINKYGLHIINKDVGPKSWTFEGSNDGVTWDILDTVTDGGMTSGLTKYFTVSNNKLYIQYRLNISTSMATDRIVIGEFSMYENDIENLSCTLRLLTGGTSSTDKHNEWDEYIVNSTLNGKITAGDRSVWYWDGTHTLASTVNTSPDTRTVRGSASLSNLGYSLSGTAAAAIGFRPVLEIKTIFQLKSLIFSNGEYKKFNPGKPFSPATSQEATPAMTSNTTPSGLAFASSIYSATYDAWYAFNKKDDSEGWAMRTGSTSYLGYGFTTAKTIVKYAIRSGSILAELPKTWTLSGSNDSRDGADGTWTTLDYRTGQTWTTNNTDTEYTLQSPGPYKFYRLNITENNGNTAYIGVNEFKLYELVTPAIPAISSSWETVSTTLPDADIFTNKGMDDLSVLDRKQATFNIPMNDNSSLGEVLGKGRMFKERIDLDKYIDIKKISVK